jgi:anti-sigma factor RsiW
MNHADVKENLGPYRDGELTAADHAEVQSHLNLCPECRADLAQWDRVARQFFAKPASSEPSPYFSARVMVRVKASAADSSRVPFYRWAVPATAMLAITAFLLFRAPADVEAENGETVVLTEGRNDAVSEWLVSPARAEDDAFAELGWEEI